ncbi:hypothetical protein DB346_02895 [Verrucomicrobia bacterium LW23]|nr:hypothetical protein DB346_03760 [Verrucomicrobia bacterium LW23]PTY04396.1 hypothetical protein DB346_02895 [Verrucomicrobia bacterium LW23]
MSVLTSQADGAYRLGRVWVPRQGPRLAHLRTASPRSNTGVAGISYCHSRNGFRVDRGGRGGGCWVGISGRGRREAWRQALVIRAQYERAIAHVRLQVQAARAAGRAVRVAAAQVAATTATGGVR